MEKAEKVDEPIVSNRYTLTAINAFCFYTFGIATVIFGQTLDDLRLLTKASFADISYGFTTCAVISCLGAFLASWIFRYVNRQKAYAICWMLYGLCVLAVPHLRNLTSYLIVQGIIGCLLGCLNTVGNVFILELWQKDSNPFMQATHFCWALGSTTAPFIVAPFLISAKQVHNSITSVGNTKEVTTSVQVSPESSQIWIPYSVSGCLLLIASVVFFTNEICHPYVRPNRAIERKVATRRLSLGVETLTHGQIFCSEKPKPKPTPSMTPHVIFIGLGAAIISLFLCIEAAVFNFLSPFLIRYDENITARKSAYLYAVFSAFHTIIRGISIFISMRVKTYVMLYASFTMILIANLLILFYSKENEDILWISLALLGAGCASVYPSIHAFIEEHIDITNAVGGTLSVFAQIFAISGPILMGNYMESFPLILIYSNVFCVSLVIALFGVLHSIGYHFYIKNK